MDYLVRGGPPKKAPKTKPFLQLTTPKPYKAVKPKGRDADKDYINKLYPKLEVETSNRVESVGKL